VRHGESEGNFERCFSPNPHIELTDRGIEQARAAGRRIVSVRAPLRIVSSPFRRALRTARLIAEEVSFAGEVETEHDLRERDIGELAGRPYSWMREHPAYRPDRFWEWRPAGGESLVDVQRRAAPVLERLLGAAPPVGDVVVVSHGGVMLALCAHVEGSWTRPHVARNCEVLVVERGATGLVLLPYGEAPAIAAGGGESAETDQTG
jgi:2,3-bisphosphoglycerate-dependent phosphoglycerate mutase